jgi:hypothetical protein
MSFIETGDTEMTNAFTIVWMIPTSTPSFIRREGYVSPEEMLNVALSAGCVPERIAQAHGSFHVEKMWDVIDGDLELVSTT